MSTKKRKFVTNTLDSISKARDLLTNSPTPEKILNNIGVFWSIEHNIPLCLRHYQKYDDYEPDFTYHDLLCQ